MNNETHGHESATHDAPTGVQKDTSQPASKKNLLWATQKPILVSKSQNLIIG